MEIRKEFFQELSKEDVNEQAINELVLKLEDSQKNLEQYILQHFIQLRNEMTNEEAKEFFGKFQERYKQGKHHKKGRWR
jgi:hypothetical protein